MQIYQGKKLVQPYCRDFINDKNIHMQVDSGVGLTFLYRYFMLRIFETDYGVNDLVQFSYLKFIDKNDNIFRYPENMNGWYRDTDFGSYGCADEETPMAALDDNKNSKFCRHLTSYDGRIVYDLGYPCLNVKRFNRWMWWTSNDSYDGGEERYMTKFSMYVSNSNDIENDIDYMDPDDGIGPWVKFDTWYEYGTPFSEKDIPFEMPRYEKDYKCAYKSKEFNFLTKGL